MNAEDFTKKGYQEVAPGVMQKNCLPKPSSQRIDALGGRDSRHADCEGGDQKPAGGVCVPPRANFIVRPSTDEEKLNKTERAWLSELRRLYLNQEIGIQNITLKLGDDCRYTPDFNVIGPNGEMRFYEVKGFMRDDALVKLKTAARQFRWAVFIVIRKEKGGWEQEEIKP